MAKQRDLSLPDHLPNLREHKAPPEPSWLPPQRHGVTPQMIGRYPDFDVFDAIDTWDEATKRVVLARMSVNGTFRFFTAAETPTLVAFCDVAVAQEREPKIPVPELIDEKLASGRLDGYQYAHMPDDRDTWRLVLKGLDETTRLRSAVTSFADLDWTSRLEIVEDFSQGALDPDDFGGIDVHRAWLICMRMVLAAFYSHPWAWNEIGFGGPAYPRGFMRLGPNSTREPFERPGATAEDPVRVIDDGLA